MRGLRSTASTDSSAISSETARMASATAPRSRRPPSSRSWMALAQGEPAIKASASARLSGASATATCATSSTRDPAEPEKHDRPELLVAEPSDEELDATFDHRLHHDAVAVDAELGRLLP